MEEKKEGGRPTTYTLEMAKMICDTIASTPTSLKRICEENDWFPGRSTIYQWKIANPEFADMYAQAKRHQAESFVDELVEIALDSSKDTITDHNGNLKCDTEWVARSRLKADTIKWIASKHSPRLYGDKLTTEITGKDDKPIEVETKLTIGTIEERIKDMLTK